MKGNTVSIRANVTRDAEVKRTQSGNNAVKWGIAWNSSKKDGECWVDVPHYFDVESWMTDAQLNSVVPNIVKGAGICIIDGHLEYQSWTNDNGDKRSKVVVRVDDPISGLMLRAPMQSQNRQGASQGAYAPQQGAYAPQQPQGAYAPQGYGYAPQQPVQQPQGYGYGQPQGYVQPPAQQPVQQPNTSVYDDDIPF